MENHGSNYLTWQQEGHPTIASTSCISPIPAWKNQILKENFNTKLKKGLQLLTFDA